MKNYKLVFAFIIVLLTLFKLQGQGWIRQYNGLTFLDVHELPDGYCGVSSSKYMKLDESGNILSVKDLPVTIELSPIFLEDGFVGVTTYADSAQTDRYLFIKYDYDGEVIWEFNSGISKSNNLGRKDIAVSIDGGLVVVYRDELGFHKRIYADKISSNGILEWASAISPPNIYNYVTLSNIVPLPDGNFICLGNTITPLNGAGSVVMKFDATGKLLWKKEDFNMSPKLNFLARSYTINNEGNIVAIANNLNPTTLLVTYDLEGTLLSSNELPFGTESYYFDWLRPLVLPSGNFVFARNKPYSFLDNDKNLTTLYITSPTGVLLYSKLLDYKGIEYGLESYSNCYYTSDGHLLIKGYGSKSAGLLEGLLVKTDTLGNIFPYFIEGNIFNDQSQDCVFNGTEQPFKNHILKVESPENTFYSITNLDGDYVVNVPEGNYELTVSPLQYWETCQPVFPANVGPSSDTAHVDIGLQPTVACPMMEVEIATNRIRNCSTGVYVVRYCNTGTTLAENATLQVMLDPSLNYLSSTGNLAAQNGDELVFALGNVESFGCGIFTINYEVPCGLVEIGETLCTEAHIYPNSPCLEAPYSGPIIETGAECVGDSVLFSIFNSGGDMGQPFGYIVIEDNIILRHEGFQLTEDEELTFKEKAKEGATYHLVAMQDPNLPPALGSSPAVASAEGCLGPVNPGAYNQFPHNYSGPSHDIDCRQVVASFDPNDKTGFPTGWAEEHLIDEMTELDYLIRFQNTGTDTAFKVVIIDTLSNFLDPTTIKPGVSSHPYRMELSGQGIVKFIFENILLPDSTTSEPGSHGFVKFKIAQTPDNQPSTVIENTAGIYFDFNAPIYTNTTFHQIREPWVEVLSGTGSSRSENQPNISVTPNPMTDYAVIKIDKDLPGENTLTLLNTEGIEVFRQVFTRQEAVLKHGQLSSGLYFFKVENNGLLLGTGKLIVR